MIRDAEPSLSVLTGRWTVSLPCGMGRGVHRHRPPGAGAVARWAAADGPRFGRERDGRPLVVGVTAYSLTTAPADVFVCDGSVMPMQGAANSALTTTALARLARRRAEPGSAREADASRW